MKKRPPSKPAPVLASRVALGLLSCGLIAATAGCPSVVKGLKTGTTPASSSETSTSGGGSPPTEPQIAASLRLGSQVADAALRVLRAMPSGHGAKTAAYRVMSTLPFEVMNASTDYFDESDLELLQQDLGSVTGVNIATDDMGVAIDYLTDASYSSPTIESTDDIATLENDEYATYGAPYIFVNPYDYDYNYAGNWGGEHMGYINVMLNDQDLLNVLLDDLDVLASPSYSDSGDAYTESQGLYSLAPDGSNQLVSQASTVSVDNLSGQAGIQQNNKIMTASGSLVTGTMSLTPDATAQLDGESSESIGFTPSTSDTGATPDLSVSLQSGSGSIQVTGVGSSTWQGSSAQVQLHFPSTGGAVLTGTAQNDSGVQVTLTASQNPDGSRSLTIAGPGYWIVYQNVKSLSSSTGVVLDRAPSDPQAHVLDVLKSANGVTSITPVLGLPLYASWSPATDYFVQVASFHMSGSALSAHSELQGDGSRLVTDRMDIALAGRGTHRVDITGRVFPFMSNSSDTLTLSDLTSGKLLTFTTDQAQQNFGFAAAGRYLAMVTEPDGTYLVGGRPARDARQAGELALESPVVSQASRHALSALFYELEHLGGQTRGATACTGESGQINAYQVTQPGASAVLEAILAR